MSLDIDAARHHYASYQPMATPTLPRKNQIVTVKLSESETSRGAHFTGLVATVSRTHGEFAVIINGRPQWFGAEEMVSL